MTLNKMFSQFKQYNMVLIKPNNKFVTTNMSKISDYF